MRKKSVKNEQHIQILKTLVHRPIETQEQLIRVLQEAGLKSTDASIARDMRQLQVLKIIFQRPIETQEQLIRALQEAGLSSTQATVSRDMRELQLVKKRDGNGAFRYVCPEDPIDQPNHAGRLRTIFRESVASCCCAQNLVVVKTLPGLANAACAAIDSMDVPGMAGSLAGDDTIFLAMIDNTAAETFCEEILELVR